MRRLVALQSCVALSVAFTLAPFQHVHHGGPSDHDHSSFMHAHFYSALSEGVAGHDDDGPEIERSHDEHSASPLDTFTIVAPTAFALSLPPQIAVLIPVPSISSAIVDTVEECGHDPPAIASSIPRAPPA
jgi:hypothetical protein